MPRETIQYGRDYAIVAVAGTKDLGGYEYEMPAEAALTQITAGDLGQDSVKFSTKPQVNLHWNRTIDKMSLPVGEEPTGYVQVSISLSQIDMGWLVQHLKSHPEDLEAMGHFHSEPLTRTQINHFIRHLKRARDAAYGADE